MNTTNEPTFVYIVTAWDSHKEKIAECFALSDIETAKVVYRQLKEIWGGDKVGLFSRQVDHVDLLQKGFIYQDGV